MDKLIVTKTGPSRYELARNGEAIGRRRGGGTRNDAEMRTSEPV
jgi:hypothetical protein